MILQNQMKEKPNGYAYFQLLKVIAMVTFAGTFKHDTRISLYAPAVRTTTDIFDVLIGQDTKDEASHLPSQYDDSQENLRRSSELVKIHALAESHSLLLLTSR